MPSHEGAKDALRMPRVYEYFRWRVQAPPTFVGTVTLLSSIRTADTCIGLENIICILLIHEEVAHDSMLSTTYFV